MKSSVFGVSLDFSLTGFFSHSKHRVLDLSDSSKLGRWKWCFNSTEWLFINSLHFSSM